MAGSRLITISKAELSPNPVQTGKSYVIRVTLEKKAYWLDYPYDYAHDYAKGDESMSVKQYRRSLMARLIRLQKTPAQASTKQPLQLRQNPVIPYLDIIIR